MRAHFDGQILKYSQKDEKRWENDPETPKITQKRAKIGPKWA